MPKLFDSLAKLRFEGDENTSLTNVRQASDATDSEMEVKIADGMWSKDGEFVSLSEPCDCSGQVRLLHVSASVKFTRSFVAIDLCYKAQ